MDTVVYATPERATDKALTINELRPLVFYDAKIVSSTPHLLYDYLDDVFWYLATHHADAYDVFRSQIPEELTLYDFVVQRTEDAVFFCDYIVSTLMMHIAPDGYRWGRCPQDDSVIGYWHCTAF